MPASLMTAVGEKLGIQERFSRPYHHESQGTIERSHQTLENMLKSFIEDHASIVALAFRLKMKLLYEAS